MCSRCKQRVYHRILEMRAPPPRDERIGTAAPAFALQVGRRHLDQARLHVDDRAVLVEHQDFDAVLPDVVMSVGVLTVIKVPLRIEE